MKHPVSVRINPSPQRYTRLHDSRADSVYVPGGIEKPTVFNCNEIDWALALLPSIYAEIPPRDKPAIQVALLYHYNQGENTTKIRRLPMLFQESEDVSPL